MPSIYLSLGTNLGDRLANLQAALAALPPAVNVLHRSDIYETEPWGVTDQPAFLNMVIQGETHLSPTELLFYLKRLEKELGRLPSVRYGPRLIDLDILFYDDLVLHTPELIIPHLHLQERAFVLVPLADIASDLIHPVLQEPIHDLLTKVETKGVKRYGKTDPTA
jgi:2-amino-4-hydroxy-6-hydroxymethyldihydropteridine diphosphokinase